MRTKKFFILGAAALLCSCSGGNSDFDASGVFETTEVIVSARGTGELVSFNVEEGWGLQAGDVVGNIDTVQLSLKRDQLAATLSSTQSRLLDEERQLASLRQQIANLETERARFEELVKADAASQKQLDDIDYNIEVLQKQLSATTEQLQSSNSSLGSQIDGIKAQISQIDEQIADCIITAPAAGVVLSKYAEEGEFAAAGRALFKIGDISDMRLRAYITAGQLTTLRIGQQVSVYADIGDDGRQEFNGTITWISDEAEFTPKTIQTRDERSNLVYAIKVSVKNDGTIKRGMYGDVKF